jgi:hypothetical protein
MNNKEKLLDKKTVLAEYHLTRWSLEWLIRTRQIEGMVRVGKRKIMFDPQKLESWVSKNRIEIANGVVGEK